MALTNRGLGLEDFRPERSAAGSPMCTSTPRVPASLCHYYRGTFLTVSIAVDNILLTLPPLCRQRRSQLDDGKRPEMISWLIRSIHLSFVFSSLLENLGSVYLKRRVGWRVKGSMWGSNPSICQRFLTNKDSFVRFLRHALESCF